ncbi:uncharacterized protein M437DRAFT_68530 [Aureobasidium melanogenum CBS 110374]|uniref:Uncharacterized protein n=1 Tax=Aureobasidium melanogenum (strain CBS 110374) TaxID=1043003 RepID=A0A074VHD3_AURM1|nr:uncharacterized protein M437DRAFT_68530 [Aureobasidium melanogenum CBS 110374]KEQ59908.1 hypothetical protein M437DRAFT_68530 [Aureobasidium melanogenum CBS 110374]
MYHANSTASIHFANGSVHDVVKIEGGASYKEIMRRLSDLNDELSQHENNFKAPPSKNALHQSPAFVLPTRLQKALNYVSSMWPRKSPAPPPEAESLLWMLKALKASSETYLETPIRHIEITNPALLGTSEIYKASISSASSALGLKMSSSHYLAAEAAARTYNVRGYCDESYDFPEGLNEDDTPYRLFVALSYNRAAFSAFLMEEVCDVMFDLRTYHNRSLGSDSPLSKEERHAMMKHALEDVTRPPYPQNVLGHEHVQDIVLFGEATEDTTFRSVLEEVFGPRLDKCDVRRQQDVIDPLFAASRGAARDSQLLEYGVVESSPTGCPI